MSTCTGQGTRTRGPARRGGMRTQHPQPETSGEFTAGLIGSAALVPPATAWASPGSAALATMPTGSIVGTAAEILGPGAQFHAYTVGHKTQGPATSTSSAPAVPVFNTSGSQVGAAVMNPATGAVELVGPGGAVLGIVQQQNGAVNLVRAGGAVLGNFAADQANGTVIFMPATTAVGTSGRTASTGTAPTGTVTAATSGTAVPVFNNSGIQVGVAETNPATGVVELIGPNGNLLGFIVQRNGAVDLVGAGGAVLGGFAANEADGTVIFMPATATTGTAATTAATTGTAATTVSTTGTAATTAATTTSQGVTPPAAPVPVFASMGMQVGVAAMNPATGAVELVGPGGAVLGVVQQQNGAVNLVGAGGAALGSFAVNQANGQLTFTPAGASLPGNASSPGRI
jgi:hypothetical protein